jgi:hypothetical protein
MARTAARYLCAVLFSLTCLHGHAQPGAIPTPDGGLYRGEIVDGKFNGQGRVEWPDGSFYQGEFRDGRYHGKGRIKYSHGGTYVGAFERGVASGQGHSTQPDGSSYRGQFRNDQYEGRGRYKSSDGTQYVGNFRKGLYHGSGTLTTPNGDVYSGELRQGWYHGQGELREHDGSVYRGSFERGRMHGTGRLESRGGVYEGQFVQGEFTGNGVHVDQTGTRHEGQFLKWTLHGPGKVIDQAGTTYEGIFENGQLTQEARVSRPDGEYVGQLQNWRAHGKGELRYANGDRYVGQFEFGTFHGEGVFTYAKPLPDGRTEDSGRWRFGRSSAQDERQQQQAKANAEAALYTQKDLLSQTLARLGEPEAGAINMYLLAIAGDGSQEVFRREVEFVRNQFDSEFGTKGRSVALINSRGTVGETPLATITAIRQSIAAIASKMDRERDILFVFITSHGSENRRISLALPGLDLPELRAAELAQILKDAAVRWKVVVLSACYSGGFIEDLRGPGTMILTAARHDRQSFGCADENEFTYFGRAFFKESLSKSSSFQSAFEQASKLIAAREQEDASNRPAMQSKAGERNLDLDSLPQIESSEEIEEHLAKWWAQVRRARSQ